jgi:hypothetical protein
VIGFLRRTHSTTFLRTSLWGVTGASGYRLLLCITFRNSVMPVTFRPYATQTYAHLHESCRCEIERRETPEQ